MGINCGVMSYNGRLYFGIVADAQAAPDVDRLREFLDQSYIELRVAAGIDRAEPAETATAVVEERPGIPAGAATELEEAATPSTREIA
jgi:hypothetical protein